MPEMSGLSAGGRSMSGRGGPGQVIGLAHHLRISARKSVLVLGSWANARVPAVCGGVGVGLNARQAVSVSPELKGLLLKEELENVPFTCHFNHAFFLNFF